MDLTPRDIQEKQFHDSFRGYDHEEVDMFLDEIAGSFDRIYRENQEFHHRFRQVEEQLREAKGSEDMLKRMLVTAQETADRAVAEAKDRAQATIGGAESRASEIVGEAEAAAKKLVGDAEAKAQQIVSSAVERERELQVSIEALKKWDSDYRARIKAFIESQLKMLVTGAIPPPPAAAAPAPAESAAQKPASTPMNGGSVHAPEEPVITDVSDVEAPHATVPAGSGDQPEEERSIRELFWGEE